MTKGGLPDSPFAARSPGVGSVGDGSPDEHAISRDSRGPPGSRCRPGCRGPGPVAIASSSYLRWGLLTPPPISSIRAVVVAVAECAGDAAMELDHSRLTADLRSRYSFLGELEEDDKHLLACGAGDRRTIIEALQALPGGRFTDVALW